LSSSAQKYGLRPKGAALQAEVLTRTRSSTDLCQLTWQIVAWLVEAGSAPTLHVTNWVGPILPYP